jgi:predicted PurR-regulated permease PerM
VRIPGRTLFLVAVIALVLWLGYVARAVVTPLVAALLVAYVLDPVVRRLERLGLSRTAASALLVAFAFVSILATMTVATTRLVDEAAVFYRDVVGEPARGVETREEAVRTLAQEFPEGMSWDRMRSTQWEGRTYWYLDIDGDGKFRPGIAREGLDRVRRDLAAHPAGVRLAESLAKTDDVGALVARSAGEWLSSFVDAGRATVGSALGLLTLLVLFPIYLYYSLAKLALVYEVGVRHLPAQHRDRVVDILGKIHVTLSAFFRGRLILLLVKFALLLAVMMSFGVPFAGVCATFAAIASLVPVLGSLVAAAIAVLLYLASGASTGATIGLVSVLLVIEGLEGYVLTPAIIGTRVGMHPLTILVGTFVAGDLLGLFGMLVAIPLAAIVKILWTEFVVPELRRQAGLPDAPPSGPAP